MGIELPEQLTLREVRLEMAYTAARLNALEETRHLAGDFSETADRIRQLEEEQSQLEIQRVETQAMIEIADDNWDDVMLSFQRRLLDLAGQSIDHELYRKYFAEIPSQVTSLSYAAEIMISKDLEADLEKEETPELRLFADRLREKRVPLENALRERTRLEVEIAKFQNRAALAKQISNKLRRISLANLEELAVAKDRGPAWSWRFFRAYNLDIDSFDQDGAEPVVPANGAFEDGPAAHA